MKRTKLITLATGLMLTFSVSVFADETPLQITPEAQAYADKLIQLSKNDQMAVIIFDSNLLTVARAFCSSM